jgi:hypothetical protein
MGDIVVTTDVDISDPALRLICDHVVDTGKLALERVLAHAGDPQAFPLPDAPNTFESIIQSRLNELRPELQTAAVAKNRLRLNAPAEARLAALGDLAQVDFTNPQPVEKQVSNLELTPELVAAFRFLAGLQVVPVDPDTRGARPLPGQPGSDIDVALFDPIVGLDLLLQNVTCLDETGDLFDIGEDEIIHGGTISGANTPEVLSCP